MPELKKYEGIFPPNNDELKTFFETIIKMCDFMLDEPEHRYSLNYTKINELKALAQSFAAPITAVEDKENELAQAIVTLDDKKVIDFEKMSSFFNLIKDSSGSSEAFVKRYGIKGNVVTKDINEMVADFKIFKVALGHEFHFTKHGFKKLNMNFHIKNPGETAFHLLFSATKSPYLYTEGFIVGAEIRSAYTLDDKEVGQISKTVTMTV